MEQLGRLKSKLWRRQEDREGTYAPFFNGAITNPPDPPTPMVEGDQGEEEEDPDPVGRQLQLAIEENERLQDTVRDLTMQLQAVEKTNLDLESKADDSMMKLDLERRRVDWQKKFYEKKIVDVAVSMSPNVDAKELLESLSNSFYQETILELVGEQEKKNGEMQELKNKFQEQIDNLQKQHEIAFNEMVESQLVQVHQLTRTHEDLIRDLLSGCDEGLFKEMKEEYLIAAEADVELTTSKGNRILVQFQKFSSEKKGIIVLCICIVCIATAGWASWGFVTWVWPRLVVFAEYIISNPQMLSSWMTFLVDCLTSPQFITFVEAWAEGRALEMCIKPFLNTAVLAAALQQAPSLFNQLKKRKNDFSNFHASRMEN